MFWFVIYAKPINLTSKFVCIIFYVIVFSMKILNFNKKKKNARYKNIEKFKKWKGVWIVFLVFLA